MHQLLTLLDFLGIVAFAATGAMVAAKHNMDVFGGAVLALVTGIGGGTVRDMILDVPVFWTQQPLYIWACLAGFVIVYVGLWRFSGVPRATINFTDAVGLAVFSVLGTQKALDLGHADSVAVIMGLLTGCGGGLIRDVLANEIPMVLSRKRLYATASLAGALLYALTVPYMADYALLAGMLVVFGLRIGSLFFNWRLPFFPALNLPPDR